jgi:hypothetical protein
MSVGEIAINIKYTIYIFVLQHILQKYLKGSLHAPKTKGSSPLLSPSFISMIDFTN